MTLAFWTASAAIMLSFGFALGWIARGAVTALDRIEDSQADKPTEWHVGCWKPVDVLDPDSELGWVCDDLCPADHFPEWPGA